MTSGRYAIIGTAGHIDHGKTALVGALTGKNTDRLKEEQERGISIDIDFAPLFYEDGTRVGMVDVPGHERFVRNMLAGAAGIDGALLAIDVNEGIKPQTVEHIAILELLGVTQGVVALTKADLADAEWIEVAQDVIREGLAGTVFAKAPMIVTSMRSGQGIAELKAELHRLVHDLPARDTAGAFRLPIDKVFSIPGFGSVVSGTIWRGRVQVGDVLELFPEGRSVRVRGIQTHGEPVDSAVAGQRAALNVVGVDKQDLRRGAVLGAPGTLAASKLIDVRVTVLTDHEKTLRHRDRVHVHLGTAESVGRVLLLAKDELEPGATGFAQLLLDHPLTGQAGDPLVLRNFSPVYTLGGGLVVDPLPSRLHRRKRGHVIERLQAMHHESPLDRVVRFALRNGPMTLGAAAAQLGVTEAEAAATIQQGRDAGVLVELPGGWHVAADIQDALQGVRGAMETAHQRNRFLPWVARSLAVSPLAGRFSGRDVEWILQEGVRRGLWEVRAAEVRLAGHEVTLSAEEQSIRSRLLEALAEAGSGGIAQGELLAQFPKRDRVALAILRYLEALDEAVALEAELWVSGASYQGMVSAVEQIYREQGPFTVAQVRDAIGSSRRIAVDLLEGLDKRGVTRRTGDTRVVIRSAGEKGPSFVP